MEASNPLALAERYLSIHRPDAALDALDSLGSGTFDIPYAWWLRAAALHDLRRYDEASKATAAGLADDAESIPLLYVRALSESQLGNLAEAERAILAAIALDPQDPDLLCAYADIAARGGQLDKADHLIAEAARLAPGSREVTRARMELAYVRGDHRAAERFSRELLADDPEDATGHRMLGASLAARADSGAARAYATAASTNPADHYGAELAREARALAHPLMWPLKPIQRFGPAAVWVGGVAVLLLARSAAPSVAGIAALAWITYCIYSWVVPGIVERRVRRGSR